MNSKEKLIDYIRWFDQVYFNDKLDLNNKLKLNLDDNIQDEFINDIFYDFAPEEIDDFMIMYKEKFEINFDKFYPGLHYSDLMAGLKIPLTNILKPIIGLKKWMVIEKDKRTRIKIKHLSQAIEKGSLISKAII